MNLVLCVVDFAHVLHVIVLLLYFGVVVFRWVACGFIVAGFVVYVC